MHILLQFYRETQTLINLYNTDKKRQAKENFLPGRNANCAITFILVISQSCTLDSGRLLVEAGREAVVVLGAVGSVVESPGLGLG